MWADDDDDDARRRRDKKHTGKRQRDREVHLERVNLLKSISTGALRDASVLFSEQLWNGVFDAFSLEVNHFSQRLGTKEARKKADAFAFGVEDETHVREEVAKHKKRVVEDGYTILPIAETARENQIFDSKKEYECQTGWQRECETL